MDKYEYKKVAVHDIEGRHGQLDVEKLNMLGREGWEMILVSSGECIFKRKMN